MRDNAPDINFEGLNPDQADLLDGFVNGHLDMAPTDGGDVADYDQAAAYLRNALSSSKEGFALDLSNPQTYYAIMAGLSIGTEWRKGLMERDGMTAEEAGNALRYSLAQMYPKADKTEEVLDPRVAELLKPEETAIIVVDMMRGYSVQGAPLLSYLDEVGAPHGTSDLDKAADKMVEFLEASRQFPMAATVFVRFPEGPKVATEGVRRKMEIEESPTIAEVGDEWWEYYKVQPQEGDIEIIKEDYDAFHETDLDKILKERGVKSVLLIGGYTSVCIDETVSSARKNGYNIFVPADLVAGIDSPDGVLQTPAFNRAKLDKVENVSGYMPLGQTIVNVWEQQAQPE